MSIFKRKEELKNPKYKAIYKSMLTGEIKEYYTNKDPSEVMSQFLQQNGDSYEYYILASVTPIDNEE